MKSDKYLRRVMFIDFKKWKSKANIFLRRLLLEHFGNHKILGSGYT